MFHSAVLLKFTYTKNYRCQVRTVFLQYLPWLLMMSRPGKKITRKTIMMQKKLKELDKTENVSRSLLVNVLDMEDNFKSPFHISHTVPDIADVYRRR